MPKFENYRMEFRSFQKDFPLKTIELRDGTLPYLLAGPEDAAHTLVLLNGGMNSYEMWLRYVKDLSRDYRVLTFDYQQMYENNQALLDGMHELFGRLALAQVVLVGASMGGIIAQLFAHKYPQDVEGMCLMSTAGLTNGAMKKYGKLLGLLGIEIGLMKVLPYSWFIRSEKKTCAKYVEEANDDAKAYFSDMFDHIFESYTREKDIHVVRLMKDFRNQELCTKEDFAFLAGKVLLLLPEDDSAFPPELQRELVGEMTDPIIVPGIKGGHLSTMLYYQDYLVHLHTFLQQLDGAGR